MAEQTRRNIETRAMEVSPMATEQPFSFMQMHPDDNAASYEAALRDHLHHEGDIEGELALQKEHFKKLKFNFIEVETKVRLAAPLRSGDRAAQSSSRMHARVRPGYMRVQARPRPPLGA